MNDLFKSLAEPGIFSATVLIILIITISVLTIRIIQKKREMHRRIETMSTMDDLTHLYKENFLTP